MIKLYSAAWLFPVSSPPIEHGALAVEADRIVDVNHRDALSAKFPDAELRDFGNAVITPGFVNAHSHLELTAMRGFLENEEADFFSWLKKLTVARLERMTPDDLFVSASWGACEAVRAGVTCFADASDSAVESIRALQTVGLRGIVFQESFGPDPRLAKDNFEKLKSKVDQLRTLETPQVRCGVSPHAAYTVCASQLEMISRFALDEKLPVMMHAAETEMEISMLREGKGPFAEGLKRRGIDWQAPGCSPIQYLRRHGVLQTRPLLAHCIHVDADDLETIEQNAAKVAHCPKSNAKLGHGVAPLAEFLKQGVTVGLGSDSVASNNTCDLLEEARFALLLSRAQTGVDDLKTGQMIKALTVDGARAVDLDGQIGELRAGLQADFTVVSLENAHQIPTFDPAATLVFSSSGRDVLLTAVAGREVYREGKVMTVDEDRLRARMTEIAGKILS